MKEGAQDHGCERAAASAAMYKTACAQARRPPKMVRLPRNEPLSRLKGASPARALQLELD